MDFPKEKKKIDHSNIITKFNFHSIFMKPAPDSLQNLYSAEPHCTPIHLLQLHPN